MQDFAKSRGIGSAHGDWGKAPMPLQPLIA